MLLLACESGHNIGLASKTKTVAEDRKKEVPANKFQSPSLALSSGATWTGKRTLEGQQSWYNRGQTLSISVSVEWWRMVEN